MRLKSGILGENSILENSLRAYLMFNLTYKSIFFYVKNHILHKWICIITDVYILE